MMNKIKYLVMDVDGTLTDGKIYMSGEGELFKAFDIKDGCGIHDILPQFNIIPIIITGRVSKILENRCKELGIAEIFQGVVDKIGKLHEVIGEKEFDCVAYIGDDINDLECMKRIKSGNGIIGCPADAVSIVREISDYVAKNKGGDGAVREFIEWLVYK